MSGRLIGVVGPSGVGKDSLMAALCALRPEFGVVRRVITRPPDRDGEDHQPATEDEFARMKDAGAFCVHWQAHGLSYGIPAAVPGRVGSGEELLVNLSRTVLADVAAIVPSFAVLNVTARPETLAARLSSRGRESAADIARRLGRQVRTMPAGLPVVTVSNDGALADTAREALRLLQPERA